MNPEENESDQRWAENLARQARPPAEVDATRLLRERARLMAGLPLRPRGGSLQWLAVAAALLAVAGGGFISGWAVRGHRLPASAVTLPASLPPAAMSMQSGARQLALDTLLQSTNAGMRLDAIRLLGQLQPAPAPAVRDALLQALSSDQNPGVRLQALAALTRGDDSGSSAQALLTTLASTAVNDPNPGVRAQAFRALGRSPAAIPVLLHLGSTASSQEVRLHCAAELQHLQADVPSQWLSAPAAEPKP
ncbi:MAG TPA: HEAT repeat domain-containing protein [Terriglobales bacterium]|nr:HEAT repeat domain-containing protein [Terriglobales bacterium]